MCTGCGVVVDRLYGVTGSGRFRGEDEGDGENEREGESWTAGEARKRDEVTRLLDLIGLGTRCNVDEAMRRYRTVYGGRKAGPGFRKCAKKERVATAFAICQTLAVSGYPRCYDGVARMCGLESDRPLLDLPGSLALADWETRRLEREEYELVRLAAADLIDPACASTGIPFALASEARSLCERWEWKLYGVKPSVIAGGALLAVVGGEDPRTGEALALIGCPQEAAARTARKF